MRTSSSSSVSGNGRNGSDLKRLTDLSGSDLADLFTSEWSSSLSDWTSDFCSDSEGLKIDQYASSGPATSIAVGAKVIVRIFVEKENSGPYEKLYESLTDQDASHERDKFDGYSQIIDDDENQVESTSHSKANNIASNDTTTNRIIYVTGKILSCNWKHPEVTLLSAYGFPVLTMLLFSQLVRCKRESLYLYKFLLHFFAIVAMQSANRLSSSVSDVS